MPKKPKGDYAIQTVTNALRLLEAFHDEEELGVTELSRRLGLHKNNVFRLLATLEQRGYIEQSSQSDRYTLGIRCLEVAQAFVRSRKLQRRAPEALAHLAAETHETAHVAELQDFEVVHLDGAPADQLVATSLRVGQRLPVYCTALGKALLGASDEGVRERFDRRIREESGLDPRTPNTITDPHKLFDEIGAAGVQGFAIDYEECAPGLCCAAAPVFGADSRVLGALSVSGPVFRLGKERLLDELVPLVVDAAGRLSRDLGYAA